jgi:transcriptional regulator with XRE-family HTH domain
MVAGRRGDSEAAVPLCRYIEQRLSQLGISGREVAECVGVTPTYLSRVKVGKVKPSCQFCIRLAECFGDSPIMVLRLVGHLPPADDTLAHEITERITTDPLLVDLLQTYRDIRSETLRAALVAMTRAVVAVCQDHCQEG